MTEYINREEAIKELREVYENEYPTASGDFDEYASHDVPNVLRNIPVADVQPVKYGRWIWDSNAPHREHGAYKCSNCGCHSDFEENFCYNCGVRMMKDGDTNG
jgi:hypothetical protein